MRCWSPSAGTHARALGGRLSILHLGGEEERRRAVEPRQIGVGFRVEELLDDGDARLRWRPLP